MNNNTNIAEKKEQYDSPDILKYGNIKDLTLANSGSIIVDKNSDDNPFRDKDGNNTYEDGPDIDNDTFFDNKGTGNDTYNDGKGNDTYKDGPGDDIYNLGEGKDEIIIDPTEGDLGFNKVNNFNPNEDTLTVIADRNTTLSYNENTGILIVNGDPVVQFDDGKKFSNSSLNVRRPLPDNP